MPVQLQGLFVERDKDDSLHGCAQSPQGLDSYLDGQVPGKAEDAGRDGWEGYYPGVGVFRNLNGPAVGCSSPASLAWLPRQTGLTA
jgi:hypothetical protein